MAEAKVVKYGFFHDKAKANEFLNSSGISTKNDAATDTWYVQFDGPIEGKVMVDVEIDGHIYSTYGDLGPTQHGVYWGLGTGKDKTQFDFVDKKPVSEASVNWPTVKESPTETKLTVSTFTGGAETYPSQLTQAIGVDGKPVKDVAMSLSTSSEIKTDIKEDPMGDPTKNLVGCNFDQDTAQAVHGRKIVMLVTNKEGTDLLAIGGQQSATWSVESESSEVAVKSGNGEWLARVPGQKSWTASNDSLFIPDDEARAELIKAMKNGELVCIGLYERIISGKNIKYIPVRKGLAIVQSDELEAPADDNATVSTSFDGTGECWMREAATPEEVEKGTVEITSE